MATFSKEKHRFPLVIASEHHVVDNVHIADKTHAEVVLRNKGKADAEISDSKGELLSLKVFNLSGFGVVIYYFAGVNVLKSRNGLEKLSLPLPAIPAIPIISPEFA